MKEEENNDRDSKMFRQTKTLQYLFRTIGVSDDRARGRLVEAGNVREGFLEKAGLEHWRRDQGSREAKGHMGKRPLVPALADHMCVLGKVSGPQFPKCKEGNLTRRALKPLHDSVCGRRFGGGGEERESRGRVEHVSV